jgi:hypothetical protein
MAINNKPASAYAKPHTMSGGAVNVKSAVTKSGNGVNEINMSIAGITKNNDENVKTDGLVTRGNGCATKGVTARGPMA